MTREQDLKAPETDGVDDKVIVERESGAEQETEATAPPAPKRLGNIEKCPACGSGTDPEAYHCPACRSSFCFRCRARVLPSDVQLQCKNQECRYYGKLICDVCDQQVIEEQAPAVYMEPEEGFWPLLLLALLVASGFVWSWTSFGWASLFLLLGFPVLGLILQLLGLNIFGRERRVEHRRTTKYHRCACCGEAAKQLAAMADTASALHPTGIHPPGGSV